MKKLLVVLAALASATTSAVCANGTEVETNSTERTSTEDRTVESPDAGDKADESSRQDRQEESSH